MCVCVCVFVCVCVCVETLLGEGREHIMGFYMSLLVHSYKPPLPSPPLPSPPTILQYPAPSKNKGYIIFSVRVAVCVLCNNTGCTPDSPFHLYSLLILKA